VVLTVTVPKSADTVGSAELPGSTMTDQGNNHVYTFPASSIATANSRLDAASFNPERNVLAGGGSQSFSVTVTVRDSGNATLDNQTTGNVTVSGVDDPPAVELSLTKSSILPGVNESVFRVSINDPDPGDDEAKTVTLTLTPDVNKGTLTIPAGSLTGLKEQVEAGMATVVYRADPVTAATDVNFTCAVQGTTSTATERLSISFVNFPPNIAGIAAALLRTDDDTLTPAVVPFPSAVVSDGNAGQLLSATISLVNSAKGTVTVPAAGNLLTINAGEKDAFQQKTSVRSRCFGSDDHTDNCGRSNRSDSSSGP